MDFQSRIAARRTELANNAREAERKAAAQAQAQSAAEQLQREAALDSIAADLSRDEVILVRQGDELAIIGSPLPALDVVGLRRSKIESLLTREARKLWTPGQNWQVISLIVAGAFLTTFYGLGLFLILGGVLRRGALNKRYRAEVRRRYPTLFPVEETLSPPAASSE